MKQIAALLATASVVLLSAASLGAAPAVPATGNKPNIVLINADDLGYGDLGCYGATKVKTPRIDTLASQGMRFTDAHSASAACTPSRYALLTGQYPFRKDLWHPIFLKQPLILDTRQMTIARLLQESGYATACVGKWHLGFGSEHPVNWNKPLRPGPLEVGFDYYFGVPVLNSHPPFVYVENHQVVGLASDDPLVYGQKASTQEFPEKFDVDALGGGTAAHALYDDRAVGTVLKEKAVHWIQENKRKPFFLYYATTNIHHPFTPAPRFAGTSAAGRYGDFIHELDWIVGEIMKTLDEEQLTRNTLVILTSDNGGMLNQGGQDAWKAGHRLNGNLLGFKFGAWEGGHRVPFIIRWPGQIMPGSTSRELISHVDMLATFAALVGRRLKDDEAVDSYNVLSAFFAAPGKSQQKPIRDHLIICPAQKKNVAIRQGRWMYINSQNEGGFRGVKIGEHALGGAAAHLLTMQENSDVRNGQIREGAPPAQLYDLESDLTQKVNVYSKHPDRVASMQALLDEKLKSKRTAPAR